MGAHAAIIAFIVVLAIPDSSCGQAKPGVRGPTINPLSPPGMTRGGSVELVVTGTNLANPTGVSVGPGARASIATEDKKGQDTAVKVRIEMPADAPIGWYPFRLATAQGVSNLRLFCVDDLPSLNSTGKNRDKESAQALPVPSVVSGTVAAEQGDYYKITAKAGQRVSCDCLSRRLGSVMDAQLTIYDAKTLRELAYDNDSPGCQTDPRIRYTFKHDGDYLIEIKDVQNRGGADYFYRLRVGDFPLATTPLPMAARRGSKAKVHFAGPAAADVPPVEVAIPDDLAVKMVWVAPRGANGLYGWPVPLAVSDHDEALEQEPNSAPGSANRIAVPGGITGRFLHGGETDNYVFAGKKGQKLAVEAHTLEFGSPTLVYLVVKHPKTGAELAKSTPQAAPPGDQRLEFTPGEDADFLLEAQHLYFAGGPSETYRLTIRPVAPTYDLTLSSDRIDVPAGGAAWIPVQAVRKGYSGPIELVVKGKGCVGIGLIKAGQNAGVLKISADNKVPQGAYSLAVVGAGSDGVKTIQIATARPAIVGALNGLPFPPVNLLSMIAVAVTEPPPFSLTVAMDPAEGVPGGSARVTISVKRNPGFAEEITFDPPIGLPATIPAPKLAALAKDKNEIAFSLDLNAKTPQGEYVILFAAKAKQGKGMVSAMAPPLVLTLGPPFVLSVEPSVVSLKPGAKTKLKIVAQRKGGYKGPIALDFTKLPANVTAAKAVIAANQSAIEVDVAAGPNAMPLTHNDAAVAGTATALNNLQNTSPAFTVRVEKK